MGKTSLLFQLLERLRSSAQSAFLFQTQCDSSQLLRYLMHDLGLDGHDYDVVRMHARLNEFLLARHRQAGVSCSSSTRPESFRLVLETVRLLSDFEAPDRKLLQIVLAGQPELAHRLSRPGLSQLRQRIAILKGLDLCLPRRSSVSLITGSGWQGTRA